MGNKIGRRRLVVDEKYARPQGHYQHRDVDHRKPLKLILDSNLTPCYPGDEESSLDLEECLICFPEEHWVIEARIKMQQQEPQHEAERIQKREDASLSSRMVTAEELNIMIHWLACFQCHLLDVQDKVMDSFLLKAHLPGQRINTYHTRGKTVLKGEESSKLEARDQAMPSSRGSAEMSQRQSPRTPLHLKATACSEANGVHRHSVDRSPKLEDGRSPRSTHHEKKRGTRVADLETKFRRAQEELKKLREQLASTESAKKEAQEALEEAKKRIPAVATTPQNLDEEKPPLPSKEETETAGPCLDSLEKSEQKVERELPEPGSEGESINPTAADVFEGVWPAPVPAETIKTDNEVGNYNEKEGKEKEEEEAKAMDEKKDGETEMTATEKTELEEEENKPTELAESPEVLELKAKLLDKEKELENLLAENERLKKKAEEVSENAMAAARAQEEKLGSVEEELKESQAKVERLGEQLETLEETRAALEAEMKRLRVQTGQWRKAAEAAAAVLGAGAGPGLGAEMMGRRRMAERCGSLDKHLGARGAGFAGWGSLLMGGEMDEEGIGGGKRRGSGIRMFGDLWKKKGHQK